jgi:hypothetical protein
MFPGSSNSTSHVRTKYRRTRIENSRSKISHHFSAFKSKEWVIEAARLRVCEFDVSPNWEGVRYQIRKTEKTELEWNFLFHVRI